MLIVVGKRTPDPLRLVLTMELRSLSITGCGTVTSMVGLGAVNWYRSWPREIPSDRAYVVDSLPRLVMQDYDYSSVNLPEDEPGFCMLEWDIALGKRDRDTFVEVALREPDRILVAPYDIYPEGSEPTVVHKVCPNPNKIGIRYPIDRFDIDCHSFGFGCIYLPRVILDAWPSGRVMRDATFSDWHIVNFGTARVTWKVRPQHLHGD